MQVKSKKFALKYKSDAFRYDPETGTLIRIDNQIVLSDGKSYPMAEIVYFHFTGIRKTIDELEFRDQDPTNTRIENIRPKEIKKIPVVNNISEPEEEPIGFIEWINNVVSDYNPETGEVIIHNHRPMIPYHAKTHLTVPSQNRKEKKFNILRLIYMFHTKLEVPRHHKVRIINDDIHNLKWSNINLFKNDPSGRCTVK